MIQREPTRLYGALNDIQGVDAGLIRTNVHLNRVNGLMAMYPGITELTMGTKLAGRDRYVLVGSASDLTDTVPAMSFHNGLLNLFRSDFDKEQIRSLVETLNGLGTKNLMMSDGYGEQLNWAYTNPVDNTPLHLTYKVVHGTGRGHYIATWSTARLAEDQGQLEDILREVR